MPARAPGSAWAWHRLDDAWAARIVAESGVLPGELVLDIGAGKGALTAPLVAAGARVIAIELHPGRAAYLRHRFAGAGVSVIEADAGESLLLPHRPFRVVANPPYGISSKLLRTLTARGSRLVRADLVLQKAFVRGFTATGRWRAEPGISLPRNAFQPRPQVDSCVLVLTPA
ncbi:23S rRNA (adenine(2058)-N(6))-methyltransferase Erm(37) [Rhizocola hellebori]|uniref:23S rRNA (Adenine(2058)-N(6))-methyltransferase Erm(37) n=1 Tax=Rhizocola hellebori TaxID=1392758 RepID=A0A8J3VDH3_9ACTN|nr:rRNA adenine N(6)-methyltransferase family protein [Rhizocola hellebori]GIH02457.1 23S rRNA (adenine(2058)-N(6))-methyltransferase Erm(37) [Rhizocola hellebori]